MSLIWVKFKNGKLREISEHIALDLQHQKTMGFLPVDSEATETVIPEPKKKIELENPVVAESEIRETVETESLPVESKIVKEVIKKRGRPAKK